MRHHDLRATVQACLLATIDVITNTREKDKNVIFQDIRSQAINVYAVPKNFELLNKIIDSIIKMFMLVDNLILIHKAQEENKK